MLVGIISDTHDNIENVRRAAEVFRREKVDLVIHLGDIVAPFTLLELANNVEAPVKAIYGNNCGEKLGLQRVAGIVGAEIWEPPKTISLDGRRILLVHGYGSTENTLEIVEALALSKKWDAVLYGHTHQARLDYKKGILILNPGEAGGWLSKPSIALLDTSTMRAKIVWL